MINKPKMGQDKFLRPEFARDLDACWLMNEGNGNQIYDVCGNNLIGTFNGNTAWATSTTGRAVEFFGNGDYIDIGNTLRYTSENFSIVIKITPDVQQFQVIIGNGRFQLYGWRLEILGGVNNNFGFRTSQIGVEQNVVCATNQYVAGETFTIGITRNGSTGLIYKNGVLLDPTTYVSNDPIVDPANYTVSTKISGRFDGASSNINGKVHWAYVFQRALMENEMLKLHQDPFWGFRDG